MPGKTLLNCRWVIWIHKINDRDWSLDSYKKVFDFDNIEDYWFFFKNYKNFSNNIFFIMRKGVPPVYEHPINENGGEYSFFVEKQYSYRYLLKLTQKLTGETLSDLPLEINGIMISPKRNNVLNVKIWTREYNIKPEITLEDRNFLKHIYKKHT